MRKPSVRDGIVLAVGFWLGTAFLFLAAVVLRVVLFGPFVPSEDLARLLSSQVTIRGR